MFLKYKLSKILFSSKLLIVLLIILTLLSFFLPIEYGHENSILEWSQFTILLFTAFITLLSNNQNNLSSERKKFFNFSSILFLFFAGREVSWGRAFYMNLETLEIPSITQVWFGEYVHPLLSIIFIIYIFYFFHNSIYKELIIFFRENRFPKIDLFVIFLSLFLADIAEHHSYGLLGLKNEVFEESFELIAYIAMFSFMYTVIFNDNIIHKTKASK